MSKGYGIIPKSNEEILNEEQYEYFERSEISEIYQQIVKITRNTIVDPIALSQTRPKCIKIIRTLNDYISLSKLKKRFPNYTFKFGNGSRGKTGIHNQGIMFEKELIQDLQTYRKHRLSGDFLYPEAIQTLHHMFLKNHKDFVIVDFGEVHNKRPLNLTNRGLLVGDGRVNVSKLVADIIIQSTELYNKKTYYLSLKNGGNVTLFNSGIRKYFPEKDFHQTSLTNPVGQHILNILNIDQKRFIETFKNFDVGGHSEEIRVDVTDKYTRNNDILRLLATGIGMGYYIVHKKRKEIDIEYMGFQTFRSAMRIKKAEIIYPAIGSAKRVNIDIHTEKFTFKMNIRSKVGTVYPTHLLCDYRYV